MGIYSHTLGFLGAISYVGVYKGIWGYIMIIDTPVVENQIEKRGGKTNSCCALVANTLLRVRRRATGTSTPGSPKPLTLNPR